MTSLSSIFVALACSWVGNRALTCLFHTRRLGQYMPWQSVPLRRIPRHPLPRDELSATTTGNTLSSVWMLRTTCPPAPSTLADSLPTPEMWEHTRSSCLQVTCQLSAEQSQQRAAELDQSRNITQLISKTELNKGCCFMSLNFGYMLLLATQESRLREKLYQQRRLQLTERQREGGTDGRSH